MTLRKISEEILRRYYNGPETDKAEFHRKEIQLKVVQLLNKLLKIETIKLDGPEREMIPSHALIATYTVPVTNYDDGVDEIACTNVSTIGFSDAWQTTGGDDWWTGGGEDWIAYQEADISITPVTSAGVTSYIYRITGLTIPGDTTASAIQSALEACNDDGYIQIIGQDLNAGFPTNICAMGIESISVTDSLITISYTPSLVSGVSTEVSTACAASDLLLTGILSRVEFDDQQISNLACCEFTTDNKPAMLVLPAQPIHLPRDIGIWALYNKATPFNRYIPVQAGQWAMIQGINHNPMANALDNMNIYTMLDNKNMLLNQTVGNSPSSLELQLLVVDINKVGETDILPIPADMEEDVVETILGQLRTLNPTTEDGGNNN